MPPLPPLERKKLVVFVGIVIGLVGTILAANVAIRDRTSAFSEGAGTPRRAGLEKLARNPTKCAMTMEPSPDNERPMRHVNAGIIPPVDLLVLGQSDADHMSKTFFKDDVRFYNGFVSNSYFVYQYEVFEDIVAAHGAPRLVLFDVRSGRMLSEGLEPGWDSPPPGDPVWWGFPPFHLGKPKPRPWYEDIPSLLSLAQTELTLTWFERQLPQRPAAVDLDDTDADTGAQFKCVPLTKKSRMYRWLADGSRIYADELDGVLAPPGPIRVSEAVGDRRINDTRYTGLEFILGRILAAGTKIIMYSPPLHPVVFDDKKQAAIIRAADARFEPIAERFGVDYCDLSEDAATLGCGAADFSDEHHISRHCNERIVRRLATGCAPRAGSVLKAMVRPEILR